MKDPKKIADELVEQFRDLAYVNYRTDELPSYACMVKCAIQSVNYTLEVLEGENKKLFQGTLLNEVIAEQIELKKILEGRL